MYSFHSKNNSFNSTMTLLPSLLSSNISTQG
nr:MAG TPA: hypothetical protein [Caudoviricetes sp.]DAM81059.1 MAG TPA: hypothetical protein [Caudoviricetes sp.]